MTSASAPIHRSLDALTTAGAAPAVVRLAGDAAAWTRLLAVLGEALVDRRDPLLAANQVRWVSGSADRPLCVELPGGARHPLIEPAARHIASRCELRWDLIARLGARTSELLPRLVAEEWALRFPEPMRWRVLNGEVHAVLSADYTRLDDIPILRSLEDAFTAAGVHPIRLVRDATRTRVEFMGPTVPGSRYRPGLVLRNSETGDGSACLLPALVRPPGASRGGVATMLQGDSRIRARHTVASPDAVIRRMVASIPELLLDAERHIRAWDAVRGRTLGDPDFARLAPALTDAVGASVARGITTAWASIPVAERTATMLYRKVAESVRGESAWRQSATDVLLPALTALAG